MSKLYNSDKKKKSKGGTRGRKKDKLAGLNTLDIQRFVMSS